MDDCPLMMAAIAQQSSRVLSCRSCRCKLTISSPAIESRVACDHYDDGLMEDFGSLADFFCDGGESTEIFSSAKAAIDAGWDFVEEHLGDVYDMSSSASSLFFPRSLGTEL